MKKNLIYYKKNNNINDNMKINNEISEPLELTLNFNVYEKNIVSLKEKIKDQENNIEYLNDRLKNYDNTIEEMTNLNIELNRLNEIIKDKNNTIEEYKKILELSKKKFEELIANKNQLTQKIKNLEKENAELKNKYESNKNSNNFGNDEYDSSKLEINNLIEENNELKKIIHEKNDEIKRLNDLRENSRYNYNRLTNDISKNRINNNYRRHENILKTEPNDYFEMVNSYSNYGRVWEINKYKYLKNKYSEEPLKYSNYLLNNLQRNIDNNYLNIK
jgi:chromosome segregation ATPase